MMAIVQIFAILIPLVLLLVALFKLQTCKIDEVARVLWTFLIVLVPLLGAVAFFVVKPGSQ